MLCVMLLVLLAACASTEPPLPGAEAQAAEIAAPALPIPPAPLTRDEALARAKARAPTGFTVVASGPFVVIGNEAPAKVRERARRMGDVISALHTDYFPNDPAEPWEAWLFADDDSYTAGALAIFGDVPDTPYGYASTADHALVMNVGTGGGTLVHEMVHPYMYANFPAAPSWFDEGLASLYEHVSVDRGHLVGHVNWRLAGLQKEIRAGTLPRFPAFLAQDTPTFYAGDRGDNYAQARYLCYWLQEKGQLHTFYQSFRAAADTDPTGEATLRSVLGVQDLAAFQAEWEAWVLTLSA